MDRFKVICFLKDFACLLSSVFILVSSHTFARQSSIPEKIDTKTFNPSTLLWYDLSAKKWDEALPVGNGRLGATIFGNKGEERIQLNEETYWSGGLYTAFVFHLSNSILIT